LLITPGATTRLAKQVQNPHIFIIVSDPISAIAQNTPFSKVLVLKPKGNSLHRMDQIKINQKVKRLQNKHFLVMPPKTRQNAFGYYLNPAQSIISRSLFTETIIMARGLKNVSHKRPNS
jgi:hypothetical protein